MILSNKMFEIDEIVLTVLGGVKFGERVIKYKMLYVANEKFLF